MGNLERRIVYLVMFLAVAVPILFKVSVPPARMVAAEKTFNLIENLKFSDKDAAFVWFDFGPNTKAENEPQAEVVFEHLMRRRIPVIIATQYQLAEAFLTAIPNRVAEHLHKEFPNETWEYGKDWISIGYQPIAALFLQSLAKSDSITDFIKKDVYGTQLSQLPRFAELKKIDQIKFVGQFTGLVGTLDNFIQYFQRDGYRPTLVHGCTSITIPEAYIFLDSRQLSGLLEGIAGAAWYSHLMTQAHLNREGDSSNITNTALGVSQLMIIILIIAGNVAGFIKMRRGVRA